MLYPLSHLPLPEQIGAMNRIRARVAQLSSRDLLIAWLFVAVAGWLLANPSWFGAGLTWDEAYYYPPFRAVGEWTRLLLTDPAAALSREAVSAGWQEIEELPPLVKWLGAFSLLFAEEGWMHLWAMRIVPAVAFATNLLLLTLIARRLAGGLWIFLPAVLMVAHPRILGHAGIAATETVFTTVTLFVTWCAVQDLTQWKWKLLLGVGCGLALATKVNGVVLFCVILFWLATNTLMSGRVFSRGARRSFKHAVLAIPIVVILTPIVALAIWPWMWHDTGERISAYYIFVREHVLQGLWYFGERRNFGAEPAPASYPFVISHLTTPLPALVLFWTALAAGIFRYALRLSIPPRHYLVALLMLAPFVASSLPGTPKYDGIRLFIPMFPAAALLTMIGLHHVYSLLRLSRLKNRTAQLPRLARWFCVALLLLLLPSLRPNIDYYNSLAQLIGRNERVFPFELTYWGPAMDRESYRELNEILSPESRIKTLALHPQILHITQQWGILREDVLINPEPPYDFHLIQNRRGFWGNAEWSIYLNREPLATWGEGANGEPLIFLFDGRPPGSL